MIYNNFMAIGMPINGLLMSTFLSLIEYNDFDKKSNYYWLFFVTIGVCVVAIFRISIRLRSLRKIIANKGVNSNLALLAALDGCYDFFGVIFAKAYHQIIGT